MHSLHVQSEDHACDGRSDLYAKIFEASRLLIAALPLNPVYFNLLCNHGMVVVKVSPVAVYFAGRQRAHNWKSSDLSGKRTEVHEPMRCQPHRLFNASQVFQAVAIDYHWKIELERNFFSFLAGVTR